VQAFHLPGREALPVRAWWRTTPRGVVAPLANVGHRLPLARRSRPSTLYLSSAWSWPFRAADWGSIRRWVLATCGTR